MIKECTDLTRVNTEAMYVPRYDLVASGEIQDPILQPLLAHFPSKVIYSSCEGARKTHYYAQEVIIVAETDVRDETRRYTDLHVETKKGQLILSILDILGKDITIETASFKDCTLNDRSGIQWLGPYNLDEILSLFHERRHLINEMGMSDIQFEKYQQAYRLLSWQRKYDVSLEIMKMIRSIEWQCWEEAHNDIRTNGLEQLLFAGIPQNAMRRHALSCYRTYL